MRAACEQAPAPLRTRQSPQFASGEKILIRGASPADYNGLATISEVTPNTFTYTLSAMVTVPAAGLLTAQRAGKSLPDLSIAASGYLVLARDVYAFRNRYPAVTNVVDAWTRQLSNRGEELELRNPSGAVVDRVEYSDQGDWAARTRGEKAVAAITRSGTTATVTLPNHGYSSGATLRILGADQADYNGRFTISGVTQNTFTYTVANSPATPATGTIIAQRIDAGHVGWDWYSAADGQGRSLELINPALPGNQGQNWASSAVDFGTPGAANSVAAANIAPLVFGVTHFPIIPRSTDPVTVTARIIDEQAAGITARVYYMKDDAKTVASIVRSGTTATVTLNAHGFAAGDVVRIGGADRVEYNGAFVIFAVTANTFQYTVTGTPTTPATGILRARKEQWTSVSMFDDGLHGDGAASDGVYGAALPEQVNNTVVEFYVRADDAAGQSRAWPAPALLTGAQTGNLLYQVDNTYNPAAAWIPGSRPIYSVIMTEADRAELQDIGLSDSDGDQVSDAVMNGTLVIVDGSGVSLRYNVGVRNRGHGSRSGPPNNFHVLIPHDRRWNDLVALNFNCRNVHAQVAGSAVWQMAGFEVPDGPPVRLRVNNQNLASTGASMWGTYSGVEAFNSEFAAKHFPDDPNGNLYMAFRLDPALWPEAELAYEGPNKDSYRNRYLKANSSEADDYSDLIHMVDVLNNASDATYFQEVSQVINVDQWLRYFALDALLMNCETGLRMGIGDDYYMYRGLKDPRFVLVPHDIDTVLGQGDTTRDINESIFTIIEGVPGHGSPQGDGVDGLKRFLLHPDILPRYYQAFVDLIGTVFNRATLDPLLDQALGGWMTDAARLTAMKQFVTNRANAVLAQIPRQFTAASALPVVGGYPRTGALVTGLSGTASVAGTRSLLVNGEEATLNARTGAWAAATTGGGTDLLVNTGDDWKYFAPRGFDVTGYQATIPVATVAAAESVIANAANYSGKWRGYSPVVNFNNSDASGGTLTFQEGAGGYSGTLDTWLRSSSANTSYATAAELRVGNNLLGQMSDNSLLAFNNIFGTNAGQIKPTDQIVSATLTLNVSNSGSDVKLHRMLRTWNETDTWNTWSSGIQANGTEAAATADATLNASATGSRTVDVTASLLAWQSDPSTNFGWALLPSGSNGMRFNSREFATAASRPLLTVTLAGAVSSTGHFGGDSQFSGQTGSVDNFVMEAKYRVYVPTAGEWTFGVNSNDGFKLTLDNGVDPPLYASFDGTRNAADTLATFNIPSAGTYNLRLVYFENTADAACELFAAPGAWASHEATNTWRLVGDVAGGGLGDSNQGSVWRDPAFNDGGWDHGPSHLGYGDGDEAAGGVVTYVDTDPNTVGVQKNATTYFRRAFTVTDKSQYTALTLRLLRDDGAVVYLNGVELTAARSNMPAGTIAYDTWASGAVPTADETAFFVSNVDLGLLQNGTNVLVVEIHQATDNSSDMSFDLKFAATRAEGSGIDLVPGINRLVAQAFDGPNGTGKKLNEAAVDIWCDVGGQTVTAGYIAEDTTWTAAAGPYRVTGGLVVEPGVTLTILPGTTVFFDAGASLTVNGRLLAEGTASRLIRFTRYPGGGNWDGMHFLDTSEDNRITYAIIEYGEGSYSATDADDRALIAVTNSTLLLDRDVFDHARYRRIRTQGSSLIVRNSTFTDIFGAAEAPLTNNHSEQIWGGNAPAGGHLIIENNVFGTTKGHNDIIDVDGGLAANGDPVVQVLNNVFRGGGDEALDIEGDFLIEGNTFANFHKDQYSIDQGELGEANTISAGDAHLAGHQYTVVRNVFYEVDHAILVKDNSFLTFLNNTVVNVATGKAAIYFDVIGDSAASGRGAEIDGGIFSGVPIVFDLTIREGASIPQLTVDRSILPAAYYADGTGNLDADPRLADPAGGDFTLLPGSPARNTGPNELDRGATAPAGASISGEPAAVASQAVATLTIAGPGITHYKYRLNNGPWSEETAVTTPVMLVGLTDGTYTVYVVGKNAAGAWQDTAAPTASRTWVVNTSRRHLRINEVLAHNVTVAAHEGVFPDMIELLNDGAVPINLAGISMSDDPREPAKFVFPADAGTIAPGEYFVLYADSLAVAGLHLGFGLNASGDRLFLYENTVTGPTLWDSVEFGPQVVDLSIGRTGHDGAWALTKPTFGTANVSQPIGNPAILQINEWYASGRVRLTDDFIELYNPDPLPVSLAGLSLTDHPNSQPAKHTIAPLTFVAGGGCLAFTADGDVGKGPDHLNFRVAAGEEWIGLFDAGLGLIDKILHYDQTANVSQGRSPDGGSWPYEFFALPTPGVSNATLPAVVAALVDGLRITEVMYDPAGDGDLEFIRLKNTGEVALDLTGVRLAGGMSFTFPAMSLDPSESVVVARNAVKFSRLYGSAIPLAGQYDGKLADEGDTIALHPPAPYDAAILRFTYSGGWYLAANGGGYALIARNTSAAIASWNDAGNWRPGTALGTMVWTGTVDGNWANAASWDGAPPGYPDSTVNAVFAAPRTVTVSSPQETNSLTVSNSGRVIIATAAVLRIAAGLNLSGGTLEGGTLTASAFDLRGGAVSSNLTGRGSLTKSGNGTVVLSGTNIYSGGTTVSGGTLTINGRNALPAGGSLTIDAGATVVLSGGPGDAHTMTWKGQSDGSWTDANQWNGAPPAYPGAEIDVVIDTPYLVTVDSAESANSLEIANSGRVTISSAGSINVTREISVTGGGRLDVAAGGSLASGGVVTVNGGEVLLSASAGAVTVLGLSVQDGSISGGTLTGSAFDLRSGNIGTNLTGAGAATKTTDGTVVLGGANSFTGGITVSAGTLDINSVHALPVGGSLTIGAGGIVVLTIGLGVQTEPGGADCAIAFAARGAPIDFQCLTAPAVDASRPAEPAANQLTMPASAARNLATLPAFLSSRVPWVAAHDLVICTREPDNSGIDLSWLWAAAVLRFLHLGTSRSLREPPSPGVTQHFQGRVCPRIAIVRDNADRQCRVGLLQRTIPMRDMQQGLCLGGGTLE